MHASLEQILFARAATQTQHHAAVRESIEVHRRSRSLQGTAYKRAGNARAELNLFGIGCHRRHMHKGVGARCIDSPDQAETSILSQPSQARDLVDVIELQSNGAEIHV